jgi:hypothetical protein
MRDLCLDLDVNAKTFPISRSRGGADIRAFVLRSRIGQRGREREDGLDDALACMRVRPRGCDQYNCGSAVVQNSLIFYKG